MSKAFVEFVNWIEDYGRFPRHDAKKDSEIRAYRFWKTSKQVKDVESKYIDVKSMKEVPKCYQKYLGFYFEHLREKSVFKRLLTYIDVNGRMPHSYNKMAEGRRLGVAALTPEEKEERALYARWISSDDKKYIEKYIGVDLKDVPLVYRCLIERLREYGIGVPKKDVYPEYLAWLEKYGIEPRASIKDRTGRLTEKEIEEETSLRKAWDKSEEKRIYMECRNKKLSSIPPEHREMVIKLKEFNVGKVQKDVYEEIVAWLEKHGTLPRGEIRAVAGDGSKKTKSRYEYTKSERIEVNLRSRWNTSDLKDMLDSCVGVPEEEIDEEYRDKIKVLRGYGLGLPKLKVVNLYEEYIAWLVQYGNKPRTAINIGGNKFKLRKDMTDLEAYEISLGQRFNRSEIRDVLNEYYGQPIEKVPMAYRYEVAELRSYGVVGQSKEMLLQKRMKAAVSRQVKKNQETREELQAELSKDEVKK